MEPDPVEPRRRRLPRKADAGAGRRRHREHRPGRRAVDGVALGLEAMRMLEDGVASAADIDTAMELGYGHPMGPLRLTDLVGLDVRLKIAEYLHRELADEKFAPPRVLREKVERGELGKKTGKGFYEW